MKLLYPDPEKMNHTANQYNLLLEHQQEGVEDVTL
jgi:hypothetical protein